MSIFHFILLASSISLCVMKKNYYFKFYMTWTIKVRNESKTCKYNVKKSCSGREKCVTAMCEGAFLTEEGVRAKNGGTYGKLASASPIEPSWGKVCFPPHQ